MRFFYMSIIAMAATVAASDAFACACGCGLFEVSTSSMLPERPGGMAWLEYDFMNQDKNWHGHSSAPAAGNDDKNLKSQFYTAGVQYMFDRAWGGKMTIPVVDRHFVTYDDDSGGIGRFHHTAFGDVRLQGVYSGFSADMSSGITFGIKLPTGDYHSYGFDRDTAIGSGSTDILLGAYHQGHLAAMFNWFANGEIDQPVLTTSGYRPGSEADAVAGVYYHGWSIGNITIAPVAQVIGSYRLHDNGPVSDAPNSGYQRLLLSPGMEIDAGGLRLYGDAELPVYQYVRGNQLVAGAYFKLNISHSF